MGEAALKKLLELPTEEKVELIDKLWESIGRAEFELSDAQRAELDRRIADYEAHPDDTYSVDEVLEGLS